MILSEFNKSLNADNPPAEASVYLKALWHDAKGNWNKAHELIQDLPDKNASWIHAYLHRKEGDLLTLITGIPKPVRKRPSLSLEEEWEAACYRTIIKTSSLLVLGIVAGNDCANNSTLI